MGWACPFWKTTDRQVPRLCGVAALPEQQEALPRQPRDRRVEVRQGGGRDRPQVRVVRRGVPAGLDQAEEAEEAAVQLRRWAPSRE